MSALAFRCPHCDVVVDGASAPLLCTACHKIVPPHPQASLFARLEQVPRYRLDDKALELVWLKRSRVVHPDKTVAKTPAERRYAVEQTAALNDAWRVLRVRFDRACVLLAAAGIAEPKLAPAQLVAFMEAREEAEDAAARPAVVARCRADFDRVLAAVDADLAVVDDVPGGYSADSAEKPRLLRVAKALAEARTLARLVSDLGGPALISSLEAR